MNCYRHFNVDSTKLNISATDQARKSKFSEYFYLPD